MDFGESMECNPPTPRTNMWGADVGELEMSSCERTTPEGSLSTRGSVESTKNKKSTERPTILIAEVSFNIVSKDLNVYVIMILICTHFIYVHSLFKKVIK